MQLHQFASINIQRLNYSHDEFITSASHQVDELAQRCKFYFSTPLGFSSRLAPKLYVPKLAFHFQETFVPYNFSAVALPSGVDRQRA
jgi:hypothetical protein